jgi:hypothetical protein
MLTKEIKDHLNIPDELENFRLIPLSLLHPFLHGSNDGVGLIFGAVFGRLFSSPCETHCSGGAKLVLGTSGMRRNGCPPRAHVRYDHSRLQPD